jgi:hypothetical protein
MRSGKLMSGWLTFVPEKSPVFPVLQNVLGLLFVFLHLCDLDEIFEGKAISKIQSRIKVVFFDGMLSQSIPLNPWQ